MFQKQPTYPIRNLTNVWKKTEPLVTLLIFVRRRKMTPRMSFFFLTILFRRCRNFHLLSKSKKMNKFSYIFSTLFLNKIRHVKILISILIKKEKIKEKNILLNYNWN